MSTLVRTHLVAAIALAVVAAPGRAQQGEATFAYINSQRIMAEAPGAQAAREALEAQMQQFQTELTDLEEQIKAKVAEYDQKQVMMSPEAKRQQQQEIVDLQNRYEQRRAELQQQAGQRQSELVEPIMQQVNEVITEIRAERGYTMIFDAAAGSLIAADPALDITDEVLQRLQTQAEATASNGN